MNYRFMELEGLYNLFNTYDVLVTEVNTEELLMWPGPLSHIMT